MMANQKKKNNPAKEKLNLSVREMPPQSSRQLEISYTESFPPIDEQRQIHRRRPAPKTPTGKCVEDKTPSDPIKLER